MTQEQQSSADVIILGAGLVGLRSALRSTARACVDRGRSRRPVRRKDVAFDGRTTAVSSSSMRMLRCTGVLDHLHERGVPIHAIRVADGLAPGALTFEPGEDGEPLGVMHENRHCAPRFTPGPKRGPGSTSGGQRRSQKSCETISPAGCG
jgi:2-octaprenyl-6-methoxyphenol hydroxylase